MKRFIGIAVIFATFAYIALTSGFFGTTSNRRNVDLTKGINQEEIGRMETRQDADVFVFGFDIRRSIQEDARQYIPFLKYLEKQTGFRFQLHFTPKDTKIVDEFGSGVVQFAAIGSDSYIQAQKKYGVVPIVRGLNFFGKAEYQSVIFTAPDSRIQKIDDVRGKRFAFGSITSTQGHLIPRIILAQNGITLEDLASYGWTGSHSNCANAVAKGDFDVGGMQDVLGRELADAGIIRIIFTSKYYPSSGIAANKDVSPDVIARVKQALIDFDPKGRHADGLYDWDKTEMPNGFIETRDEDYAELRQWSEKLGLMGTPKEK